MTALGCLPTLLGCRCCGPRPTEGRARQQRRQKTGSVCFAGCQRHEQDRGPRVWTLPRSGQRRHSPSTVQSFVQRAAGWGEGHTRGGVQGAVSLVVWHCEPIRPWPWLRGCCHVMRVPQFLHCSCVWTHNCDATPCGLGRCTQVCTEQRGCCRVIPVPPCWHGTVWSAGFHRGALWTAMATCACATLLACHCACAHSSNTVLPLMPHAGLHRAAGGP